MNPKDNKEDIEELNFDDVELEIKLDDNNLKLDLELDDDANHGSNDSDLNSSSNSAGSESQPNEAPSQGAPESEDLPANTGDSVPSTNDEQPSPSPDNNLNDENNLPETIDESLPDEDNQGVGDNTSKEDGKEEKKDSDTKKENDDKKSEDKKDEKSDDNKDRKSDDKNEKDNKNNKEDNKEDSKNNPNEKDNKNPKDDKNSNDKGKDNNNSPNKDNNEPKSGLDKKRDDLKNQRDNKPKPGKDSKPGLKDKGKNFGKNLGNNLKNGAKNKAKDALNNSGVGQAVNKAADTVDKAKKAVNNVKNVANGVNKFISFLSTPLGQGIAIGVGVALIFIILLSVFSAFIPNLGGEVEDEENYSRYSVVDQKVITNLRKLSDKYNGEPSYAMVATLYPYIEELQGGNVTSLRGNTNEDLEDDILEDDENAEEEEIPEKEEDDENDLSEDDPYLELFRERYYMNKFKKLLKKSMDGEDALTDYLKKTYFKSDKGYKKLFDDVDNEEELADAIIDDLLSLKDDFNGYFFESRNCTVNLTPVGTVEIDELLKSNIFVDVKVDSCTSASSDCASWHTNPISLKDYILGVVWTEKSISTDSDFEQVKAQMVAAKAYALGRHTSLTKQTDDGSYVITMLSNTNDQDYCDYTVGCPDNKRSGNEHKAAPSEVITLLEQAWEDTKNVYVYDETKKSTVGSYCANRSGVCDKCSKGSCMSQTELSAYSDTSYSQILGEQYSKYSIITVEGDYAQASVSSGTTCSASGYGIPDNQFKFYYQTDYPDKPFCAATDGDFVSGCPKDGGKNSICTSGCGATSFAMLISNLSDTEFDPVAANEESASIGGCATGSGTYDKLFTSITSHEGFTIEKLSNDDKGVTNAIAALKNGALIAANVQANSDFTSGGHWILLRGLTEDNMVKVADPNSKERSLTGTYSINKFIDENWLIDKNGTAHSWYAIYGPKSEEIKGYSNLNVEGEATGTLGYPVEGVTGCDASDYPNYSNGNYHGGTDINASVGALDGMNILAADGGTVKTVKNLFFSYGSHVIIDHENGYTTLYAHMQKGSIVVKAGDKIAKGQLIGKLGSTGNSTGPHLHIELRKDNSHNNTLNPCTYIGTNNSYLND